MNRTLTSMLAILLSCSSTHAANFEFSISQSRLSNVSDSTINNITAWVNSIALNNTLGGVECQDLNFFNKSVNTGTFKASIDTKSELDALLLDNSYSVYIVEKIGYCGGPAGPGVVGCAAKGTSMVVEDMSSDQLAGVVWLHEFGHTQGLSSDLDGVGHTDRAGSIMNASVGPNNSIMNKSECAIFKSDSTVFKLVNAAEVADGISQPESSEVEEDLGGWKDILFRAWIEGAPIKDLKNLAETLDINDLRAILFNKNYKNLWENTITAIAIVGEESDISFLESFFRRESAGDKDTERARLAVPFAIGYLSARFETSEGHNFLALVANPNRTREVFSASGPGRAEFLSQELAKEALKGAVLQPGSDRSQAIVFEAKSSNDAGAFDLGVDAEFFEVLEEIKSLVTKSGIEAFAAGTAER